MAYADLGGLGSKQGEAVMCDYSAPSLVPQFLPWLAILALLLLRPNRCGSAWWVWVPLLLVVGITGAPRALQELLPGNGFEMFLDLIGALGFGLAAVWLLSAWLAWKHRVLAFLGVLLAAGAFSSLSYLLRQGLESETLQLGVFLACSVLVVSVALTLAGLVCRGRYGWPRLSLWLLAALVAIWLVVITPFFVAARISSGGNLPLIGLVIAILVGTGVTFGVLLPFLVLSFANGFYRERLKGLLHLGAAPVPPLAETVPPPVVAETAGG